ncbi:CRISPR-associated endonuclease Cas2 [Elioraea sp.]|uniref:CRISPR-associated endonuclease Cas2 n=1 Tax=Elioraea sp. TaxID=2185103 RepID=UPI0025C2F409|nr:CRISPR-associated endonuclease Cas2 [Elioraea sp.]
MAWACFDFGQRVQEPVCECEDDPAQWALLRTRLVSEVDPNADSPLFYRLGADGPRGGQGIAAKAVPVLSGPLLI